MTQVINHGEFTPVTQADLDALEEGNVWKDRRIPNWKNENGEFLFPTIRDAMANESLAIVVGADGIVYSYGSGTFAPPPSLGGKLYELPAFTLADADLFRMKIFDPLTGEVSDPPSPAPTSVTRAQALMALHKVGLLPAVRAAVAAHDLEEVRIWFDNALNWERSNPYVVNIGMELALTEAQIDELFLTAKTLGV